MNVLTHQGATDEVPPSGRRITVTVTPSFRVVQWLHAGGILVVPMLGSAVAVWLAVRDGLNPWHVVVAAILYTLTVLGITVGFHRLLSHRAFQVGPIVFSLLSILGSMAAQGAPIYWVSNHRRHHQFAERSDDPHSPHAWTGGELSGWRGFLHAHIGWTFEADITNSALYAKDLLRNRLLNRLNRLYFVWVALGLIIPMAIGALIEGGPRGLLLGFLWGGCVRLALSYHFVNGINSLTHLSGTRPFDTRDESRNNLLLVLPTFGEGWHNNHHAFPGSAIFGVTWWQLDPGGWLILALERCGLAWNVTRPYPSRRHSAEARPVPPGE